MKIRTYIIGLAFTSILCSCEREQVFTENSGVAYLHAEIAGSTETGSMEVSSRADVDNTGTYTAFKAGDVIGLYTDDGSEEHKPGSLKTNEDPMQDVKNVAFTLGNNEKWQKDDAPLLKWDTEDGKPSDIYGYFPYQKEGEGEDFSNGGYRVFTLYPATNKLQDVLVAERTTVENNNPAIFLTFKHRFALLKIKLGTGLEGVLTDPDNISVIMNTGIESTAKIDKGTVDLQIAADGIKEFKRIKNDNTYYYIIVPVEKISETDSLEVESVKIEGVPSKFNQPFIPRRNTVYNVTVHKGEEGSIAITMGGIEEWGSDRHQGNIREEGGIYWYSDVWGLTNALNKIKAEGKIPNANSPLSSWGTWNETEGYWVFPVMRNIDMTEYTSTTNRNCCIEEFYGVLDGRGRYISGLDIKGAGFIGTAKEGAVIKDLELRSIAVDNGTSGNGTGALVGNVEDGATIHNCSVTGTSVVKGGDNTGGLVGKGNPTMDRCSSNADVTGGTNTGGLIGELQAGGSISQSYTVGTVEATGSNVGGLAGSAAGKITNSHAGCDVKGKNNVGGLVGSTTDEISGCTATGNIVGEDIVGGLAGSSTSAIKKSGANGSVTGTGITGGLIGKYDIAPDIIVAIEESYSRSAIVSGSPQGGLVGVVTKPYQPEIPEIKEQKRDEESGELMFYEDGEPIMVVTQEYVPAKGTEIIHCYATNGVVLVSNTNSGISYSYEIGAGSETKEKAYYTIPLTATSGEVEAVIAALNASDSGRLWVKGLIMIDGKAYMLPVLNYK